MSDEYIALVRSNPCSKSSEVLLAALADAGARHASAVAFFHGDGCNLARRLTLDARPAAALGQLALRVCATSWTRRYESPPPRPLGAASLMFLFQRMAGARRIDSIGNGGWFCCTPAGEATQRAAPRLLLEIASAPVDDRQQRETLEVALGAAALELDAGVFFHGPGLKHLAGPGGRGWCQITDFGLLEMFALAGPEDLARHSGVVVVDLAGAVRLRAGAETILLL